MCVAYGLISKRHANARSRAKSSRAAIRSSMAALSAGVERAVDQIGSVVELYGFQRKTMPAHIHLLDSSATEQTS
jgi:hypothetical protein